MNIVIFTHPSFFNSQSMPRFAKIIVEGMKERGHKIEVWSPKARFARISILKPYHKWLGYIDQYIVFPAEVRNRLRYCPLDTLFVIADNALGPWVPLITNRPHVIHCNDFLAQLSALDAIQENRTNWTGKRYQEFIRRGYKKGKRFISISQKTKEDLHYFLLQPVIFSEVVYLGLNSSFSPHDPSEARLLMSYSTGIKLTNGYLLHVGGNQWYKNRIGIIEIYDALRLNYRCELPLILIGEKPNTTLLSRQKLSPYKMDIHWLSELENNSIRLAYAGATTFLFPSLAEGFGWPIAEAMACGCPVLTTNEAPMTEVAGGSGFLIQRRPKDHEEIKIWAVEAAAVVNSILSLSPVDREKVIEAGFENIRRFNAASYLDKIETIYKNILNEK